jgi:phage terminase large subunit-like protein
MISNRPASSRDSSPVKRTKEGRERAQRVIDFIQGLTVPSGTGQGQPFKLMEWQKDFIRDIYEPHRKGKRAVRRAILSVARKNGKTALIAAICLAHLVGPERIVNGEIYSAANDRDQAAIVYKFANQIVALEPELRAQISISPSTKTMVGMRTGSIYRAVSAEAGTKHGYLPSVVVYDELAQAKSRDLYDVLDTSFGARDEPLFITISTQSNDPEHILSKLIDDGLAKSDPSIICHLYAADEECALDDEAQWAKANPALGKFRNREDLVTAVAKAVRMPAEEPKVRNLFLNQRVAPTASLIARAEWVACAGEPQLSDGESVFAGLDLSSVADLTALVIGSANDPCRIRCFAWKPLELLDEHSARDFGTGSHRYREWVDAGHLLTTPGRSIDPGVIALFIAELSVKYKIRGIAFDRWRMAELLREFDDIGLQAYEDRSRMQDEEAPRSARALLPKGDGLRLVPWGQGFKDMAGAVDEVERLVYERQLVQPNSPLLNWCMANAVATVDPAGNRKIDKAKSRFRVDAAIALAMMAGLRVRDRGKPVEVDIEALIA